MAFKKKKSTFLFLFYVVYTNRDSQAFEAADSYRGFALRLLGFRDVTGKLLSTTFPK